ncbi:C45 family autoproteolytic acyltransferase/hydrolase [Virgibacillus xinjiangensis]|uniref:C45 family autoproteolytic acyltransferase/hydrolase n=1 Tax=Virgibacillus xinjiangensis TaxID=393090 RepID=A0ABV7CYM0_9BACI
MQQVFNEVIQFRGSHYDFGLMQGERLKDSHTIRNRKKEWKIRRPRFQIDVQDTKQAITAYAPGVWEELLGIRDALEWKMTDVLQEFGGYRLEYKKSGCSIYTGTDYMIRNYDYHPKTYDGCYTIYQPDDQGYAIIGPSQRTTGRMDGMNEKGLALGYNFMHRKKPGDGFICNMIGRMVLETCANVDEAVSMLKDIPHRHSFSYIVLDRSGVTYVVEATPRSVVVRESNVCTNHFEMLEDENRHHLHDSYKRMNAINQRQKIDMGAEEAFQMLNDRSGGVFSEKYKAWAGTIHTSAYLPKQNQAWFALGGDQTPYLFDFHKWLEGEDLDLQQLHGQLDTDIQFVHSDWKKS